MLGENNEITVFVQFDNPSFSFIDSLYYIPYSTEGNIFSIFHAEQFFEKFFVFKTAVNQISGFLLYFARFVKMKMNVTLQFYNLLLSTTCLTECDERIHKDGNHNMLLITLTQKRCYACPSG